MKKSNVVKAIITFAISAAALIAVLTLGSCSHTHSYTEMKILQSATCYEVGVQQLTCKCGDFQLAEIPKTEHVQGEWKVLNEQTCITKGSRQLLCRVCEEVIKVESTPALGHDLASWGEKAPTCAEEGHKAYQACTRCDYTTYEAIKSLPHTPGAEATCDTPQYCLVCEGVVTPAKGHVEIVTTGSPATCTKTGLTDKIVCLVCEKVLQEQIEIPKRAHVSKELKREPASCSSTGRTAGEECVECGYVIVSQTFVSKTPHTYSGSSDKDCNVCGEIRTTTNCLHKNDKDYIAVVPTCAKYGTTAGLYCEDCKAVLKKQNEVSILDHTEVVIPMVPATPTRPGLTEGKYCSQCRLILKQQEVIPALSRNVD